MTDLEKMRKKINAVDDQMQQLFNERMETAEEIGRFKASQGLPVKNAGREKEIIDSRIDHTAEAIQPYYRRFQNGLFSLSRDYQNHITGQTNRFLKNDVDSSDYVDAAFTVNGMASKDNHPDKINATIGTLYDETGTIAVIPAVYESYSQIDDHHKASYASRINGNEDFNEAVFNWINRLNNIHLPHAVTAAPGGTGSLILAIFNALNPYETLLIPDIAWGSYATMAAQHQLSLERYVLSPDTASLKEKCREIMQRQHRVVVIINDPCQNPTGLSLGKEKWQDLISFFNELSKQGPITVINDIAYFDYAADAENATAYMEAFNDISDNVLISVAFSCSKSFTAYGMRLGALVSLAKDDLTVRQLANAYIRTARATWSNVNNGFMHCFADVMNNHQDEYCRQKEQLIQLLKQRSDLFISQAEECGLPLYPYSEGFFLTIPVDDPEILTRYHEKLMDHHIYTVKFSKGIRVAICSLSLKKINGLPYRMKKILSEVH